MKFDSEVVQALRDPVVLRGEKNRTICVRLDPQTLRVIGAVAQREGLSVAGLVRVAVMAAISDVPGCPSFIRSRLEEAA